MTPIPNLAQVPALWRRHVGAASLMWAKINEDQLLRSDGRQEQLVGLIQARYERTRAAAARQARHCLDTWSA